MPGPGKCRAAGAGHRRGAARGLWYTAPMELANRHILLGVTGGVAAFKAP